MSNIKQTLEYWKNFYESFNETNQSSFAEFVYNHFLINCDKDKLLLDVGCGNGRDSLFFAKNGFNVVGVDISIENRKVLDNLEFLCLDITDLEKYFSNKNLGYIYSRFSLHAINEKTEDILFNFIRKYNNIMIFIEARTINDELFGVGERIGENEFIETHYRRFIDLPKFINKINDFNILYIIEDKNLSIYKNSNPTLMRLVAKKYNIKNRRG